MLQASNEAVTSNPLLALAVAVLMSIVGSTGIQSASKDMRRDPFTGQQGSQLTQRVERIASACERKHGEQEERLDEMSSAQDKRLDALEAKNVLYDDHLRRGVDGNTRLATVERKVAAMEQRLEDIKHLLQLIREDIRASRG